MVISNTLLTNNRAVNGSGGAIVSYGTLTILQSTFEENAGANGGAVYPRWDGSRTFVDHSIFRRNSTTSPTDGWGGAILLWDGAQLVIQDSRLEENSANRGGGIYNFPRSSIVMTRTVISANTAQYGGGIYNERATLTLSDSILVGNTAERFGGGIENRGGVVSVTSSNLNGNSVTYLEGTGGAVNNTYSAAIAGALTMTDSTVSTNNAGQRGGGIFNSGATQLLRVTLDHNSAPAGGAIYNEGTLELNTSTLSDNTGATAGALYQAGSTLTVRYSTIADNSANDGSAIHLDEGQRGNTSFQGVVVAGGACAGETPQSAGNNLENGDTCGFDQATRSPRCRPAAATAGRQRRSPADTHARIRQPGHRQRRRRMHQPGPAGRDPAAGRRLRHRRCGGGDAAGDLRRRVGGDRGHDGQQRRTRRAAGRLADLAGGQHRRRRSTHVDRL